MRLLSSIDFLLLPSLLSFLNKSRLFFRKFTILKQMNFLKHIDLSTLLTFTKELKIFFVIFYPKNIFSQEGFLANAANLLYSINGH
ncbi:hypothetical protein CG478_008535 [Bacillus cytotoxicus]|nr:hypothetical protein CG480_008535 [Bacillus cytotoxicus]AWC48462.1 hypothetical protein CG478_008535 [Bacillus cytotoxicus]